MHVTSPTDGCPDCRWVVDDMVNQFGKLIAGPAGHYEFCGRHGGDARNYEELQAENARLEAANKQLGVTFLDWQNAHVRVLNEAQHERADALAELAKLRGLVAKYEAAMARQVADCDHDCAACEGIADVLIERLDSLTAALSERSTSPPEEQS